jgi:hypothetical protein
MSPKSVQRFWDNDMHQNKDFRTKKKPGRERPGLMIEFNTLNPVADELIQPTISVPENQ